MHAVIYIVYSLFSYGSKVGAHYRSTLFPDLNWEITMFGSVRLVIKLEIFRYCFGNYVYLFLIYFSFSEYFLMLISKMQSVFGGRI